MAHEETSPSTGVDVVTRLDLEGIDREHVQAMWRLPWWVPAAALAWALASIVATAVRGGPAGAFVCHGVIAAVIAGSLVLLRHGGGGQVTQLQEDRVGTGTRTWRGQLDPEWVPWSDVDHVKVPGPWEDEARLVLRAGARERTLPGLPAEQPAGWLKRSPRHKPLARHPRIHDDQACAEGAVQEAARHERAVVRPRRHARARVTGRRSLPAMSARTDEGKGRRRRKAPSRANYAFSAMSLFIGALVFLGADDLSDQTRHGFPVWLLGAASLAVGVFGLIWTAVKRHHR